MPAQRNGRMAARNWIPRFIQPFRPAIRRKRGFTLVELVLAVAIVAILSVLAAASYSKLMNSSDIDRAKSDLQTIAAAIERYSIKNRRYPESLSDLNGMDTLRDPWGNPYQYLNITTHRGSGSIRKDHNLVPLNTDYDLYSMGADGRSTGPLTAQQSRDDILRANNGGFIGLASDY